MDVEVSKTPWEWRMLRCLEVFEGGQVEADHEMNQEMAW